MLRPKNQADRTPFVRQVTRIAKPVLLRPIKILLSLFQVFTLLQSFHRLIFVTNGKLQSRSLEPRNQLLRIAMIHSMIMNLAGSIPVNNDPIEPGQFHQQHLTLQRLIIPRVIGSNEGVVVRGNLTLIIPFLLIRIKMPHRPMPPPLATHLLRRIPRHVVSQQNFVLVFGSPQGTEPQD